MMTLQNLYHQVIVKQTSATNGATITSDIFDTLGFREVDVLIHSTTADAATNKPSVLKLQHADTTDATNFGDITGLVGGTSFTLPNMPTATTNNPYAKLNVNMKGKKRYLRLLISPVTTQTFSAVVSGARAEQAPNSTTEMGVAVFATA